MDNLISIFKALSDRNRLRIIAALMEHDQLCACQLTELLQVTGATASRHMGILISAGLVNSRKEGRWVFYRLNVDEATFKPVINYVKYEFASSPEVLSDRIRLAEIKECDPEDLCRKQRGVECCPR